MPSRMLRRCPGMRRCSKKIKTTTTLDRKSTRLNSSHDQISYAVFCLKKKKRLLLDLSPEVVYDDQFSYPRPLGSRFQLIRPLTSATKPRAPAPSLWRPASRRVTATT